MSERARTLELRKSSIQPNQLELLVNEPANGCISYRMTHRLQNAEERTLFGSRTNETVRHFHSD